MHWAVYKVILRPILPKHLRGWLHDISDEKCAKSCIERERKESKGPHYPSTIATTSVGLVGITNSYPVWHYPFCTHRNFGVVNQNREDP